MKGGTFFPQWQRFFVGWAVLFCFLTSSINHNTLFLKTLLSFSFSRLQSLISALNSRSPFCTYANLACIYLSAPSVLTTIYHWQVYLSLLFSSFLSLSLTFSPSLSPSPSLPSLLSTLSLKIYLSIIYPTVFLSAHCISKSYISRLKIVEINIPESSKKRNVNAPCLGNYSHGIHIVLTTVCIAFTFC